ERARLGRLTVRGRDGAVAPFDAARLEASLQRRLGDLAPDVSVEALVREVLRTIFDGIETVQIERAVVLAALTALLLVTANCSRRGRAPGAEEPLRGNAVWFAQGLAEGDAAIEESLLSVRSAAAFVPARRFTGGSAGWSGSDLPAPAAPLTRVPVVLVIEAPADPLAGVTDEQQETFGGFLSREIASALARGAEFGPVRGVHLDLPFSAATTEPLAAALREARSQLANELSRRGDAAASSARGIPLTFSLRAPASSDEEGRDALRALASRMDGVVAFVFGGANAADPAFTESLGKPWWSAYDSRTTGTIRRRSGAAGDHAPESLLDRLTEDPRSDFRHEVPWNAGRGFEFSLTAGRPLRLKALSLSEGDGVVFSQPPLADLIGLLRAAPSGRLERGRVVVVGETSDSGRVFPVSALADVFGGRPVAPAFRASVDGGDPRLLRIGAENPAAHASAVSRVENWIEVDLAPARLGDVEPGGFDRWEAYDAKGRAVSPGRATRVRLYETFVAPFERLEPARVQVRGKLPDPCCPVRARVVPASGGELESHWALPGAPAPTAAP
ncbi:MAG TPA: hypothetical protein VNC59_08995, partial [Thermoanaerobaculia bacterium]|nr:hypothetical protein [Thermoanaerobaculia bacterium]